MDPQDNRSAPSTDGVQPGQSVNPTPQPPNTSTPPTFPEAPPQSTQHAPPPKKRRLNKKLLIVVALVVLLGAAAALALTQLGNNRSKQLTVQQVAKNDIPLLRIGTYGSPLNSIYPHNKVSDVSLLVNNQIFEGLVRYENQTKIVPTLATGWSNPDSSTWIFNLRTGVEFHTGHIFAAKDVKYSIETIQKENSDFELFYQTIKSVDVLADNKVKITTDGPDPILLNKLTFMPIIDSQSNKKDDPANGTGPYSLKPGTSPGENNINLVAFNKYYGGHIYTRELQFTRVEDENKLVDSFNAGKYDIVGSLINKDSLSKAKKGAQRYIGEQPGLSFLTMNTTKAGPLQKLQVRQALQQLVDVPAIAKVKGDFSQPVDQLIPKDIPGYNPSLKPPGHSVAKAKELLAAAGYPKGLTLNLLSSGEPPELMSEIQRQYAEGGVTLKLQSIDDFDQFLDTALGGGPNIDLAYIAFSTDVLDGTDFLNVFVHDNKNYNLPEINQLLDEINQTTDQSARLKKLQQAAKLMHDQASVVPLTDTRSVYLINKPYILEQDSFLTLGVYFYKAYLK